jgi:hypothetical protein
MKGVRDNQITNNTPTRENIMHLGERDPERGRAVERQNMCACRVLCGACMCYTLRCVRAYRVLRVLLRTYVTMYKWTYESKCT